MEWWWDQPGVPHVAEFNAAIKKITGVAATARNWFGYASVQTLALVATRKRPSTRQTGARASGFKLRRKSRCKPGAPEYRAGDHELMSTVLRGRGAPAGRCDPDKMFTVRNPIPVPKPPGRRRTRLQGAVAGLTGQTDRRPDAVKAPGRAINKTRNPEENA